ncbi:hypothetical protein AB6A40_002307 [Gnathostoma spinigerum]|uniref:BHLH domain-containing protein n=1 Tax=Gnathostoma spinigerum TaxID=75299 RepID=A0ABD6EFC3_9BILA
MVDSEGSHTSAFQYSNPIPTVISAARLLRLRSAAPATEQKSSQPISPFSPEARVPMPNELDEQNFGTSVWKRNERERYRVRCVNDAYEKLRDHLPIGSK